MSTISPERTTDSENIKSLIPARLDRLDWSKFHTRLVIALGVAWILDGLEITIAANVANIIEKKDALAMSSGSVAFSVGTIYLLGEVFGALFFGRLSDKWGRKNLFMITLGVYLAGGVLTACTAGKGQGWVLWLDVSRFVAGAGIGGEYAAINSAIDELIPAKYRGRVDIGVNGTYWAGAFLAAILTVGVVNNLSDGISWRIAFLIGPALGFVIIFVRKNLPESPRWLLMHGRTEEAEVAVKSVEDQATGGKDLPELDESKAIEVVPTDQIGFFMLAKTLFATYPKRAILGATLMITQSFLYNAIFFTYALVLTKVYGVDSGHTEYYFMAFAAGNLIGPLVLGKFFDTIGRRQMISGTYLISSILLAISAVLFKGGHLSALSQTIWWSVIFFFASAGASAAYLTVSEIFPLEIRAKAIAVFFAIAQFFGSFGPWLYGHLIGDGTDHTKLFYGYLLGAGVMAIGGIVAAFLGVDAAGKSLEEIATPLSVQKAGGASLKSTRPGAIKLPD
jgi:MFS family permease